MNSTTPHPFFDHESLYSQCRSQTDPDQTFLHCFAARKSRLADVSIAAPHAVRGLSDRKSSTQAAPMLRGSTLKADAIPNPLSDVRTFVVQPADDNTREISNATINPTIEPGNWSVVGTGPNGSVVLVFEEFKDRIVVCDDTFELPLIVKGGDGTITRAAWDGAHRLAVGYIDGTVELHDLGWGEVETARPHTGNVTDIALVSDGRIVSGSEDTSVVLWDPVNGAIQTMAEHADFVRAVAVLPDGRIVSGSKDQTVKLWDPAVGTIQTMAEHTDSVNAVAALPDGRIASRGDDNTAKTWDPVAGLVKSLPADSQTVFSRTELPAKGWAPPIQILTLQVRLPSDYPLKPRCFHGPLLEPQIQTRLQEELDGARQEDDNSLALVQFVSLAALDNGAVSQMMANVPEFAGSFNSRGVGTARVLIPTNVRRFSHDTAILLVCE